MVEYRTYRTWHEKYEGIADLCQKLLHHTGNFFLKISPTTGKTKASFFQKNIFLEYVYFRTILIINAILMNTKLNICLHVSLCTTIT